MSQQAEVYDTLSDAIGILSKAVGAINQLNLSDEMRIRLAKIAVLVFEDEDLAQAGRLLEATHMLSQMNVSSVEEAESLVLWKDNAPRSLQ